MSDKTCQETDKANPDTKLSENQGNFLQAAKLSPPASDNASRDKSEGTK
jgi:hypothetical protein